MPICIIANEMYYHLRDIAITVTLVHSKLYFYSHITVKLKSLNGCAAFGKAYFGKAMKFILIKVF